MYNETVYNTLSILRVPNEIIEIRIPKTGYKGKEVNAGYFDDVNKCCAVIEKYNGVVPAIYTNLNPINPALLARAHNRIDDKAGLTAQDADVIKRTWLYLDIDPVRPAGISSTDEEHNNAIVKAHEINTKQNQEGWSEGIICDSGNGASLLFRIDLPNSDVSTNLIKKVLSAFDFFYSDEKIQIDTSVFNAARIVKLYGTTTKKGDNTKERPHRVSGLISVPTYNTNISLAQLIEFAAKVPAEPEPERDSNTGSFNIQTWMHDHNLMVSKTKSWHGGTLYVLDECPFDPNHKSPDACIIQGKSGALAFKCLHNSCSGHGWHELRTMIEPECNSIKNQQRIISHGNSSNDKIHHNYHNYNHTGSHNNQYQVTIEPTEPRIIELSATTDLGNAKRFIQLHGRNIRYVPPWKCFMVWDGTRWVQKDERQMVPLVEEMIINMRAEATAVTGEERKDKLMKHAIATEAENRIMACIRLAASQPEICATIEDFDQDKYLLNFINGTVDLRTGKIREFKREDMITRICKTDYIPEAPCPIWEGFLDKIFAGDKAVIEYMQKFMGMAYTGDISEELFHIFHGSGSNGKTTFLTTHNAILGKDYFKTMGVETLLKRGQKAIANDIARLQGARIVWANEPEYDDVLTEGKIKKMVSKEKVLGEMKFKEPVEFEPEYSLIMSTNPKPRVRGTGKGWQRRVRFIPFDVEIKDDEKDIHFAEKLNTELPGIAAWAINGAIKWQHEGLTPPEKILIATNEYHQDMDKFAELFDNLLINEPQAISPFLMLYTVYEVWATNEKMFVMSKNAFSRVLSDRGYKDKTARYSDGRQFKGYIGITVNNQLSKWVTDFLTSADTDNSFIKMELLNNIRNILNPFKQQESMLPMLPVTHLFHRGPNSETDVRTENNGNMGNIGNSNAIIDNNELVTSVTLVTKYKIIEYIKELFKHINKPESMDELNGKVEKVLTDIQANYDYDNENGDVVRKMIHDYMHALGWE